MEQQDFRTMWLDLQRERSRLLAQRTTLETDLSEVVIKITHIEEVIKRLVPLSGWDFDESVAGLGITDAIRNVLKHSEEHMTAADVRRVLEERGFSFVGHSAPNASIYKVLSRLSVEGGEIEREKLEDGSVFYKWKPSADDIPF